MAKREVELATTFADVARSLLAETDVNKILQKIVTVATEVIDPCESAGIDIIEKRKITPVASSSDFAARIAALQNEVNEGPCLSAIREHDTFRTDDLLEDERWPDFGARAHAETGVRSILGFRLYAEADTMGALNLYSSQEAAFADEDVAIGSVLAAHAAVATATAKERDRLESTIESRDVIGQAKGILMARDDISEDEAFDILSRASQRLNIKLRDVAERVVEPPPARPGPTSA